MQLVTQSFRNWYKHRLKGFLILFFSFISDQRAGITEVFKHDMYLLLKNETKPGQKPLNTY